MIHLNIGSNLNSNHGSRFDNISIATQLLLEAKLKIDKVSNFYETPSYPNQKLPKFINIGILAKNYDLSKLNKTIYLIEKKIGRIKTKKNDPRVIDVDIIDFNGKIKDSNNLILPHPRAHLRNFVLYPILEIDPKWSHPILKKNAQFLINNLSQKSRIEITRLYKNVKINHA
tara:strand:- start:1628 stop:2143 length:516 start_codon:yes stop_codon:yes gene_type:complete